MPHASNTSDKIPAAIQQSANANAERFAVLAVNRILVTAISFQPSKFNHSDQRHDARRRLRLKVAIIHRRQGDARAQQTYRGHTCDISQSGLSVIVDHNIFTTDEVTVVLALPPEQEGAPMKIVEATARMVYTVHSARHQAFRVGLNFVRFTGEGKQLLEAKLARS